jgi:hypothetical protein
LLFSVEVIRSSFLKHKKWPEFLPTIRGSRPLF